jgi:hypothetical protein
MRRPREVALLEELDERLSVALAEPRLVALVTRAAEQNWRAAAWLLERRYPERWASRPAPTIDPAEPARSSAFAEVDELAEARRRRHPVTD